MTYDKPTNIISEAEAILGDLNSADLTVEEKKKDDSGSKDNVTTAGPSTSSALIAAAGLGAAGLMFMSDEE